MRMTPKQAKRARKKANRAEKKRNEAAAAELTRLTEQLGLYDDSPAEDEGNVVPPERPESEKAAAMTALAATRKIRKKRE